MRYALPLAILLCLPMGANAQTPDAPNAEEIVIEGVGLSQVVPCEGRDVGVYGADNKIDLTGECGSVVVHGDGHEVSLDKALSLALSGADHTVTAKAVTDLSVETTGHVVNATMTNDTGPARVAVSGSDQTLNLDLTGATELSVGGTNQVVNWALADGAPDPRIDITGIDNAVNRVP